MENQNSNNNNEYYSIPLATMTFGKEQLENFTFNNNYQNNYNFSLKNDNNNNLTLKNPNANFINDDNKIESSNGNINTNINNNKNEIQIEKNTKKNFPHLTTFQNKINSHNSFISPILYAIYYMKIIRNYILNEAQIQNDKNSLLYHLKKILSLMPENKKIDLTQFRNCLSENFQNRRKFLLDNPDDPSEIYFILINAIHSNYLQFSQKEISDYSCREKCISHRFLWLDIARIDYCECGLSSKRLFSNHNYIFDINLDKIFEVIKTLKEKNVNNYSNNNFGLYDLYGKLFYFYKLLLNFYISDCPVNGVRCNVNKTHKKLILNNNPSYLVFSFQPKLYYTIMEILKIFILIPKNIDLTNLFEISNQNGKNNSMIFNLFGFVLYKNSKNFSSVFKDHHSCSWLYYDDDNVFSFTNFYEVLSFCLKNAIVPIMLFYKSNLISSQNNNMFDAINDNITSEQCSILEKYALNSDSIMKFLDNKIRTNEDYLGISNLVNNNNGFNNILNKDFYLCYNCQWKNKINDKICQKCGINNTDFINGIINTRQNDNKILNYSPIKIQNINSNNNPSNNNNPFLNNANNGSLNHPNILPISLNYNNNNNNSNNNNNNHISSNSNLNNSNSKKKKNLKTEEEDEENIDPRMKKYYDMPKPYIPKKEGPIMIKSKNNNNQNNNNQINNINNNQQIIKNKNPIIPQNEINYVHSNTNPNNNNNINNSNNNNNNNYNSQVIQNKKKLKESKIIYNNENEDRIIPFELLNSKKRPGTASKNSYNEIKNYNNKFNNQDNLIINSHINNNNHHSNTNSKIYINDFWICPNCNYNNNNSNMKCKYCDFKKKKDKKDKTNRVSTPLITHQKNLDKKHSINNFERKLSERKYSRVDSKSKSKSKSKSNDKKNNKYSHSKNPNGLYFVSGNTNLSKPINNNNRFSTSNVSVNLGVRSTDSTHNSNNSNNFKRKKNNYKYNK